MLAGRIRACIFSHDDKVRSLSFILCQFSSGNLSSVYNQVQFSVMRVYEVVCILSSNI